MAEPVNLAQLGGEVRRHAAGVTALRERVDYLTVAVMRGDPRFATAAFSLPDFDSAEFDRDWTRRGKRVPSTHEVFGGI